MLPKDLRLDSLLPSAIDILRNALFSHEFLPGQRFHYEPLDESRSQIRLLEIIPSYNSRSTIRCRVWTSDFEEATVAGYAALSYTWGNLSKRRRIKVNDRAFFVTEQLERALRSIRSNWSHILSRRESQTYSLQVSAIGPFWIDGICINQQNNEEKSWQVGLMGSIYSNASFTIAFLSDDSTRFSMAINAISTVNTCWEMASEESISDWEDLCPKLWKPDSNQFSLNKVWLNVIEFAQLPFWTRIWILQELVLSREVLFMVGRDIIPYSLFKRFEFIMRDAMLRPARTRLSPLNPNSSEPQTKQHSNNRSRRKRIAMYLNFKNLSASFGLRSEGNTQFDEESRHLSTLLFSTTILSSSDPRDRVFALLGITSDEWTPDYSKSVAQVYTEIATKQLMSSVRLTDVGFNFSILQLCGIKLWRSQGVHAPSWVPCWAALSLPDFQWIPKFSSLSQVYSANDGILRSDCFIQNGTTLRLDVVICDEIVAAEPLPKSNNTLEVIIEVLLGSKDFGGFDLDSSVALLRCLVNDFNCDKHARLTVLEAQAALKLLIKDLNELLEDCPPAWVEWAQDATVDNPFGNTMRGSAILMQARDNVQSRRIAHTRKRRWAMTPTWATPGDIICVIKWCQVPMLLRKEQGHHVIIGPCYVHELMDGEASRLLQDGCEVLQSVEIH
jgi:Heterokaryon incompatibility protein (HET)